MIQLPQIEGATLDLITIIIFFAILFTQSKDIRTSRNFFIAILSCIIIDSVDLFYNAASSLLFFIIYFVFFKSPNVPVLSKINYFIKSLLITLIFVNISGILTLKLMNRFNIAAYPFNLAFISLYAVLLIGLAFGFQLLSQTVAKKTAPKLARYIDDWTRKVLSCMSGVILLLLIFILQISHLLSVKTDTLSLTLIIFTGIVFISALLLIFLVVVHLAEIETKHQNERIRDSKEYVTELENNYENLRHYQHDYKNILLSAEALAEANKLSETKQFLASAIHDDTDFSSEMNKNTQYITDTVIRGLVLNKSFTAKQVGVSFTVLVNKPLDSPSLSPIVLTRLLGILFDNAIEAATTSELKKVEVLFDPEKNYLEIIIKNTFDPQSKPNLAQIFDTGYSTKGNGRGIGLATVKDITRHYNNILVDTTIENGFFTFSLVINKVQD